MKVLNQFLYLIFVLILCSWLYWEKGWLTFLMASIWIIMLVVQLLANHKKRKLANFVIFDKNRRIKRFIFGVVLTGGAIAFIFYIYPGDLFNLVLLAQILPIALFWLPALHEEGYYLFDNHGISDKNNGLSKYSEIKEIRVSDTKVAFDTSKYINDIVIKRHLVSEELLDYLKNLELKIEVDESTR